MFRKIFQDCKVKIVSDCINMETNPNNMYFVKLIRTFFVTICETEKYIISKPLERGICDAIPTKSI